MKCLICNNESEHTGRKIDNFPLHFCPGCKSEFIFPQPSDEELKKLYSEEYYDSWGNETSGASADRIKKLTGFKYLDRIQKFREPGKLLDVGCAMGFFLEAAQERAYEPYGVEFSEYSAEIAKSKFGDRSVFNGTLEQSDFMEKTFDVVVMFDLLEHVRDPLVTLKKAENLLKQGGILMITTPDLSRFLRLVMGKKWLHYKLEHLFYFHRSGIKKLFSQTGLKIENITTAKKAFTFAYAFHQFNIYKHIIITPLTRLLNKVLPSVIKNKPFYLHLGEMNIILSKK